MPYFAVCGTIRETRDCSVFDVPNAFRVTVGSGNPFAEQLILVSPATIGRECEMWSEYGFPERNRKDHCILVCRIVSESRYEAEVTSKTQLENCIVRNPQNRFHYSMIFQILLTLEGLKTIPRRTVPVNWRIDVYYFAMEMFLTVLTAASF